MTMSGLDLFRYVIYAVLFIFWHDLVHKLKSRNGARHFFSRSLGTRLGLAVLLCFYEALIWGLRV